MSTQNEANETDAAFVNLDEFSLLSKDLGGGQYQSEINAPAIHCGGCMRSIEKGLGALPGVEFVRVNLSTKRVKVRWRKPDCDPNSILRKLTDLGFEGHIMEAGASEQENDPVLRMLVRCLAVTGFGAANVMGLSISVWSGADPDTQLSFHSLSAFIAGSRKRWLPGTTLRPPSSGSKPFK